jgi:hypothetical protein
MRRKKRKKKMPHQKTNMQSLTPLVAYISVFLQNPTVTPVPKSKKRSAAEALLKPSSRQQARKAQSDAAAAGGSDAPADLPPSDPRTLFFEQPVFGPVSAAAGLRESLAGEAARPLREWMLGVFGVPMAQLLAEHGVRPRQN